MLKTWPLLRPRRRIVPRATLPGLVLGLVLSLGWFYAASAAAQSAFYAGISVHLTNGVSATPLQLGMISAAGANSVRDDVHWSQVETEKGRLVMPKPVDTLVDEAMKRNIAPLLILDYGNALYDGGEKPSTPAALDAFARYAVFVVTHFKGRVHLYEMWNEWDNTAANTRRGTPQEYVRFLKTVYPAIKAADPSAVFIAGSISAGGLDWLSAMLSSGAVGSFDALSIHPYNFARHARTPEDWAANMLQTEAVIHRSTNGQDVPLYVTEMGWPTHSGPVGTSPSEAASFAARMFLLARTMPFLKGIWWYDFRNDGTDGKNAEDNFGLVDAGLQAKPAFAAFQAVAPLVRTAEGVEVLPSTDPAIHALRFHLHGTDEQVLALWATGQSEARQVHVTGKARSMQGIASADAASHPVNLNKNEQSIPISDAPVLVTGTHLALQ